MPKGIYDHSSLRKPKETRVCAALDCDVVFEVIIDGWNYNKKYCSHSCIRRGKPNSKEHRKKSGEGLRGRKHSLGCLCISCVMRRGEYISKKVEVICQWCDKKYKVEPWRVETTKYCSRSCHGKARSENIKGENNPNWRGGSTNFPYPPEFNKELSDLIRERDNYTCQLCEKTEEENGRRLSVHHIDYNRQNCNPKNLTTLCTGCNVKVNYNRVNWGFIFLWDKLWEGRITNEDVILAFSIIFEEYKSDKNLVGGVC